jgi:hypothetical protein
MDNADPFRPLEPLDEIAETRAKPLSDWTPILPVPKHAPELERSYIARCGPPGFALAYSWVYKSAAGELMMVIARYDRPGADGQVEKQIRPFTYGYGSDGVPAWRIKSIPEGRPLYALDHLAASPTAPVLVVEGEKAADAAAKRFPDYVVTTSSGGSQAAAKADWSPLKGRPVTVWPDADKAGKIYAAQVAGILEEVGASNVLLVDVPPGWPEGWDLGDLLPSGVTDADLARLLANAGSAKEEPLPLFPALPPAEPFPIDYLGPVLSSAAGAIARKVRVPLAMAAQSVLAAASLAAQAHADVRLPFGQTRPLSLFLVTIAASGDRKTTADAEALGPVRKHERARKERHEQELGAWRLDHAAWSAQKKKIEAKGNLEYAQRKEQLRSLGPEPEKPLYPILTAPDPTLEGLVKAWVSAPASLGVFTAEGGMFVGGHGMADENKLRTGAALSELWDGKPVKRLRAVDGVTLLYGRRLSLHVMVQPEVARQFLSDGTLRDQGLLSRMLVAAPASLAGTRLYREVAPADELAIVSYTARIFALLEARWPLAEGKRNELEPRVLPMTGGAIEVWTTFFNHVEAQSGPGGDLDPIADLAAKAAEHAARIAGVITLVENPDAAEIVETAMECGVALADWYVAEALRLAKAGRTDPKLAKAQEMLGWLQAQKGDVVFRDILRFGPGGLRLKSEAEAALRILESHGWVEEVSRKPRVLRVVKAGGS